jgi:hypothetical protein
MGPPSLRRRALRRFANTVEKELHVPTTRTGVHVESLSIDEELAEITEDSPPPTFMKVPGAEEIEVCFAA